MAGHAVIVGRKWTGMVSADYPGVICRNLEGALGGVIAFAQGPGGDERPVHREYTFKACEQWAKRPVDAACELSRSMEFTPLERIICSSRIVRVPVRADIPADQETASKRAAALVERAEESRLNEGGWRTKRLHEKKLLYWRCRGVVTSPDPAVRTEGLAADISALALGPSCMVMIPAELFTRTAQQIVASVRPNLRSRLAVCGYGNSVCLGYLPTREDIPLGGYEASASMIASGGAELVAREAAALANETA
jgi:hypothetical protein